VRMENVLPGAKNLGTTHITKRPPGRCAGRHGCHRLHPVEWNVGEAAGAPLKWC